MRFADIPGHHELKEALRSSFRRNHLAHAQLFLGQEGSAVLPLSIAFASYLLCERKTEDDSCDECPTCHKMAKLIHPDTHFFFPKPSAKADPAKAAQTAKLWREFLAQQPYGNLASWLHFADLENKLVQISKDDSRKLIQTLSLKPFEADHKVIFIWYPELMHSSAANAILKVLEEPPDHTLYILVSYNIEQIITTITSRTQLVQVPPFADTEVKQYLLDMGVSSSEAETIARISDGSLLKAQALTDNTEDMAYDDFQSWMRVCFKKDYAQLVKLSEEFAQTGRANQVNRLRFALNLLREAVIAKAEESNLQRAAAKELEFIKNFSKAVAFEILESIIQLVNDCIYHLERNANPRIAHLNLSIKVSDLLKK
ncbi:MAG: DNA polymerase III subunit delta [Bacteroidota bacterium]